MKTGIVGLAMLFISGSIVLSLQGDLNGDKQVNHGDLFIMHEAWGDVEETEETSREGSYKVWFILYYLPSTNTHIVDKAKGSMVIKANGDVSGSVNSDFFDEIIEIRGSVESSNEWDLYIRNTKIGEMDGYIRTAGTGKGELYLNDFCEFDGEWMAVKNNS
jgi:hypothetical protein